MLIKHLGHAEAKSQIGTVVTPVLGVLADLSNQETRTLMGKKTEDEV